MATGLFGVSWTEIIDFLLKLAPAASIVGGILAARVLAQSGHQSRRMYASLQQQMLQQSRNVPISENSAFARSRIFGMASRTVSMSQ